MQYLCLSDSLIRYTKKQFPPQITYITVVISIKNKKNYFCLFETVDIYVLALDANGLLLPTGSLLAFFKQNFSKCPCVLQCYQDCAVLGAPLLGPKATGGTQGWLCAVGPWLPGREPHLCLLRLCLQAHFCPARLTVPRQPPPRDSPDLLFLMAVCPQCPPKHPELRWRLLSRYQETFIDYLLWPDPTGARGTALGKVNTTLLGVDGRQ